VIVGAGPVVCSVCGEPSEGGAACGRCGSALPEGAPTAPKPEPAPAPKPEPAPAPPPEPAPAPKPPAPTAKPLPQGKSLKRAPAKKAPRSAASDLEAMKPPSLPEAGSASSLPTAGSSGISPDLEITRGYSQEEAPALPAAGRRDQSFTEPAPRAKPAATKTVKRAAPAPPLLPAGAAYIIKSAFAIVFLIVLAGAGVLLMLSQMESQSAKAAAPRLARRYLTALATIDYANAYYLLSIPAQARCTIDEFRRMRGPGVWDWGNLKLVASERDAAEMSYEWSTPGHPKQTVYLFFIRENDRWVVPYNLQLMKRVEDAMRHNDPDLALLESQEAVRVNPRDPMARAYLCEAANYRKMYDQAKTECAAALALSAKYPSSLTPQSIERLKTVNASLAREK